MEEKESFLLHTDYYVYEMLSKRYGKQTGRKVFFRFLSCFFLRFPHRFPLSVPRCLRCFVSKRLPGVDFPRITEICQRVADRPEEERSPEAIEAKWFLVVADSKWYVMVCSNSNK